MEVALKKSKDPLLRTLSERMDLVSERKQMVDLMVNGRHGMVAGRSYGQSLLLFRYKVSLYVRMVKTGFAIPGG